jgi:cytochrome c553
MRVLFLTLLLILLFGHSLKMFATPQTATQTPKGSKTTANKNTASDPGEQKFKENCGRCHNPPDSLSPREVKAVVQHMRVRAMLSAEDEQLILKYLAP